MADDLTAELAEALRELNDCTMPYIPRFVMSRFRLDDARLKAGRLLARYDASRAERGNDG